MLAAKSSKENYLSIFSLFLRYSIEGKKEYNETVNTVLNEVVDYNKSNDPLKISSENYEIVVYLKNNFMDRIEKFDLTNRKAEAYKELEDVFSMGEVTSC